MLWNFLELEKNGRCHKSLDSLFKPHIRVSTRDQKMINILLPVESLKYQCHIIFISSVRSSNSHPDLLVTHHHPPTFSDHNGPQHWT